MSVAFDDKSIPVLQQEYATKADLHYGLRISYSRIAIIIEENEIPAHLIGGKIQYNVKEFVEGQSKKRTLRMDLFA